MQTFSQVLLEVRNNKNNYVPLTLTDIDHYVDKVKKQLPKPVLDVIYLTKKYQLLDSDVLQTIMKGTKNELGKLTTDTLTIDMLLDLQKQLLSLKTNIRLLPQMQSAVERESIMNGKILASDLTIDLSTPAGRNAVAKLYTPLVYKIANQFVGKCSFDRAELISIGLQGLAEAINRFDPERTDKPFKTFASYLIRQCILTDIDAYSHDLSGTNWYATKNYADKLDAVSIDSLMSNDDDEYNVDHLAALGTSDDLRWIDLPKSEQEYWETLYKIIDAKFTVKERNIFYRYFGLGEFWGKKEKSKDIAKSYGMSEGNIRNSVINKILKFLKSDPKTRNILDSLRTIYNESLMRDLIYLTDKQAIYEYLINDDMFILLEELNRWSDKNVLINTVNNVISEMSRDNASYIISCLNNGIAYGDNTFRQRRSTIVEFLQSIYPTETFNKVSDTVIMEKMVELAEVTEQHKITW